MCQVKIAGIIPVHGCNVAGSPSEVIMATDDTRIGLFFLYFVNGFGSLIVYFSEFLVWF